MDSDARRTIEQPVEQSDGVRLVQPVLDFISGEPTDLRGFGRRALLSR
jgi:hypothetical protein